MTPHHRPGPPRLRRALGKLLLLAPLLATAQEAQGPHAHGHAHLHAPAQAPDSHRHGLRGVLGRYPVQREASGTAWQPDLNPHAGWHGQWRDWMLMGHALLNGVYDWQQGPRGGERGFLSGMLLGAARRELGTHDRLQLRAMLSPDPLMGPRGLPLLLATGETADGVTPLMDRQHPHDLFMELSAALAHDFTAADSVFLYAGLPGEPAFGPPAFQHRLSIADSPEPPISHHWLDSTHITFGVLTAGVVHDRWKLELSRFRGREPDQHRYDIETGPLDSTAARVSFNPAPQLALQLSWAGISSPEQLAPGENQRRWSASAIYTRPLPGAWWSSTLAWGRRTGGAGWLDAQVLESALRLEPGWTFFVRLERVDDDELLASRTEPRPVFTVGKISAGALRDIPIAAHLHVGLGALYALDFVPAGLATAYGRREPSGAMVFLRLRVD